MRHPLHQMLLIGVSASVLLAGCATPPPRGGDTLKTIQATVDEAARESTPAPESHQVPKAVSDALLPPISVTLPGTQARDLEPRFDVRVNAAPAREFFMGLAEGTDSNMVVHPDVKGTISLDLKNVTINQVMETVRDVYGYEYRRTRTGYQVLPIRMRSQIFQINYLNVKRAGKSQTQVSSGQVSERVESSENGETDTTESATVAGSRIETESESDFWSELTRALTTMIGSDAGRSVVVSPQSGLIVVRALPSELREVGEFLRTSQAVLQRQVILEAKIVEVTLNDGFQSGINWA